MTVEGEHVYHVSTLGVLAHNSCPIGIQRNPRSGKIEQLLPANGRQASLKGSRWNTAPSIQRRSKLPTGLEDHHAVPRSFLEWQNPHDFALIAKAEGVDIVKARWNIGRIPHRGGHTNAYYGAVRSRVDMVYRRYLAGGSRWDASRIDAEFSQVADGIFADIASGKLKLYK